jgi:signal transduction histidine kinase
VAVRVHRQGAEVHVEVSDDGRGLDEAAEPRPGHLGLQLLRENLEDFGGGLTLRTADAGGATLTAVIPADVVDG